MSSSTINLNNGQQMTITTDLSKIFVWNNRYSTGNYTNSSGDVVTLLAGTLLGRIGSTLKLVPQSAAATDGSEIPLGVLADDYVVADGATVELAFCVAGDVVEGKVILTGAETMDTLVGAMGTRTIRDHIGSDTVGVKLVPSTENTIADNY